LYAAMLAVKVVEVRETPLLNRVIFVMAVAALPVPLLVRVKLVTVTVELLGLLRTT